MKMTAIEMIKKYKIEIGEKDGIKGMRLNIKKAPTSSQVDELKANKPAIMAELEKIAAEKKAAWEIIQKENAEKHAIELAKYLATANLKRYLIRIMTEGWDIEWSIDTLDLADSGIAYQARYFVGERISLPQISLKITEISSRKCIDYGMTGAAYEITEEEETEIIAEQKVAIVEADKQAAIEKIEKEEKAAKSAEEKATAIQTIFETARITGKKQVLHCYMSDCNDPNEQCDVDTVYIYAMPNGSEKSERNHTW